MSQTNIKDKYFCPILIILGIYLLFRLINEAQMIWYFPLDITRDLTAYISMLFFLVKTGFHELVTYWYNGFVLFQTYPPAWYYFTLPFYYISKSVTFATYFSIIIMYILSFILINYLGKIEKFSFVKRIAFFLLLFANPISISYLLRLGRPPEFFAWVVFLLLFLFIIWYKNHDINKYFYFVIPIFSILILSHPTVTILSSLPVFSLFLIKNNKQRLKLVIPFLISILITSFWWIPFLINQKDQIIGADNLLRRLINSNPQWIFDKISTWIFPVLFLFLSYLYIKNSINKKREILFLSPLIIIAFLLFTRLLIYIPLFNEVYPDPYIIFFIFLSLFLFFKVRFYNIKFKKLVSYSLVILPILFIISSLIFTPLFNMHTPQDKEIISFFENIDGRVVILANNKYQLYAYSVIYNNISSPSGGARSFSKQDLWKKRQDIWAFLEENKCSDFNNLIQDKELEINFIIANKKYGNHIKNCGFKPKEEKDNSYLFKV